LRVRALSLALAQIERATAVSVQRHKSKQQIAIEEAQEAARLEKEAAERAERSRIAAIAWHAETHFQAAVHLQQRWRALRATQLAGRATRSATLATKSPLELVALVEAKSAECAARVTQLKRDVVHAVAQHYEAQAVHASEPPTTKERPRSRFTLRRQQAHTEATPEEEVAVELARRARRLRRSAATVAQLRHEQAALDAIAIELDAKATKLRSHAAQLAPARRAVLRAREVAQRKWRARLATITAGGYHQRLAESARWEARLHATLSRQDWRSVLEQRIIAEKKHAATMGAAGSAIEGCANAAAMDALANAEAAWEAYLAELNRPRLCAELASACGAACISAACAVALPKLQREERRRAVVAGDAAYAAAHRSYVSGALVASAAEYEAECGARFVEEVEALKEFAMDEAEQLRKEAKEGKKKKKRKPKSRGRSRGGMAASPDLNRMLLSAIDPDALEGDGSGARPPSGGGMAAARHLSPMAKQRPTSKGAKSRPTSKGSKSRPTSKGGGRTKTPERTGRSKTPEKRRRASSPAR
jgi:hypothetical protein